MNEFTKEELKEIIESFDLIESETWWDWKHPLRNKIKSMIDNYDAKAIEIWHCEKCGHAQ